MNKSVGLVIGFLLMSVVMAYAVPNTINYQGILTDGVGLPINGNTSVTFRLFAVDTGGSALWTETQPVDVVAGTYSVQLGAVAALTGFDFSVPYWLEVEVGGETLTPRQELTSVPYAMRAATVERIDETALPSNGLNEISNGLLGNQFIQTTGSKSVPIAIPDNNPTGIEDSINFPDVGSAEGISVAVHLENSDLSTVTITLTDPDANIYTLFDGSTGGTVLDTGFPEPMAIVSGDLSSWVGQNPTGTWTLKVVDAGFLNNSLDGNIVDWSLTTPYLSTQRVEVTSDLVVAGSISGNGLGLLGVDWRNLASIPSGFADNVDNFVTSINGLPGGEITSSVGIGVSPQSVSMLTVRGSGVEPWAGYYSAYYTGTEASYGLYGMSIYSGGPGSHYGMYGHGGNSTGNNYGVSGYGENGTNATGIYGTADSGTVQNVGIEGSVVDSSSPVNYGVLGLGQNGTGANYGVYGEALGSGTSLNYGVYGTASGTNNYAGYFDGDVSMLGNITIGTNVKDVNANLKVEGGTSGFYSGYFEKNSTNSATAIYAEAHGVGGAGTSHLGAHVRASGANSNYGLKSYVSDSGAAYNHGVNAEAMQGYINYALKGAATSALASQNYGLYASAYNGTDNYAVYGHAGGATNDWAGYFFGNVGYTGTLSNVSDRRLKENIYLVEDALDKIQGINGVYYNLIASPGKIMVGVIAQDVQAVLPEAVTVMDPENGYLGVSYPSLIPVLIEAVKELKAENDDLKARVLALESK